MTKHAGSLLASAAAQIGVAVAVERNRKGQTQEQVGQAVGLSQLDISNIETGKRLSGQVNNGLVEGLFNYLGLPSDLASFVGWWRDHGT
jgi:transcriptional regulator with XRE-family HTH domain